MKHLTLIALLLAAGAAGAQTPATAVDTAKQKLALATCSDCGTVQAVNKEKRKGEGGAVGIVAGAAAGGLLGNQVGGGTGKTLATVGGAVAGGFVGNEVQKRVTAKDVWVTQVKLKDGSLKKFEQEQQPAWKAGAVVKVKGNALASL
jgi:outer membrane lipoprotein SlyB